MKKMLTLIIGILMIISMTSVASAETMTLTLTVPEAEYTLVIPQNMEVPYRAETVRIGTVSVKDAAGFNEGKNLMVTVSASPFTSETTDTVLYFTLTGVQAVTNAKRFNLGMGTNLVFEGQADGSLLTFPKVATGSSGLQGIDFLEANFNEAHWDFLNPGNYTAVITFEAEIVEAGLVG